MNTPVYVVDTETTGLLQPEPPASGVVEVGALQIHPETLEVISEGSARVNPGCPIEPGASNIHGIYDQDVVDCPKLGDVWGSDEPIIMGGHNHPYDEKYLLPYVKVAGNFCTLALSRQWLRGPPNYKLQTLREYFNLPGGEAHSALGDCYSTLALLHLIVRESNKSLMELVQLAGVPRMVHVMPYGMHKGKSIHELPLPYVYWFLQQNIDANLRYSLNHTWEMRK